MFKLFIIIFRETLEVSILLGIIAAATQGIKNRLLYINSGILIGILGASLIAIFTNAIFDSFGGYGQEIVNAGILLIASSMLIWTLAWMKTANRNTTSKIKIYGQQLAKGNSSLLSITIVTASSIFREGFEIVLFSHGILASTTENIFYTIAGGILGFITAMIIGLLIYKGIIKIAGKYLFHVTSIFLSLIAAGMAAQAANFLAAGNLITQYQIPLWDTSWIIPQESFFGKILNFSIGYVDNPTGMEVTFYVATLLFIYTLSQDQKS